MITIEERKPSKIPGETTLFVTFDYKPELVDIIKGLDSSKNWDSKNKEWEIPVCVLSKFLDKVCLLDDIELKFLSTTDIEPVKYKLSKYKTKPFKYQEEAIQYGLQDNHNAWLLLDAPGLGKTLTMICLAQELKKKEKLEHCLIVCGVNALKVNWKNEIEKHSNLSCRILGERITKKGNYKIGSVADRIDDLKHPIKEFFIITNIETLRDDDVMKELLNKKAKNKFDMIVCDEVHAMKNPSSIQGKHFLKLTNAKHRIGLTGTILTNNPCDCYVPLKWIGADNSTFTNFKFNYCTFTGPFNNILLGYKNIDYLKEQLSDFSLRRTKDILDLPSKNVITEYVEMDDNQSKFYKNVAKGIVDQVDKVEMTTASLLAMVTRLRQATECPTMLTTEDIDSAKIDRACQLVEEITSNNEKVVIFSNFKETLNILKDKLKEYKPLLCTGDVKDEIISKNVEAFQNDKEHKVMLCTVSKMGTGFTLTAASYSIFLSTPWTYALFEQAQDRIYRIGAKNPVFIYTLLTKDTIDEHVYEIVSSKKAISEFVVDNKVENREALDILRACIAELSETIV